VDHNDPQQMVKEVGALAFPAACNVPLEAVGALPCILVWMGGWMGAGRYMHLEGFTPPH